MIFDSEQEDGNYHHPPADATYHPPSRRSRIINGLIIAFMLASAPLALFLAGYVLVAQLPLPASNQPTKSKSSSLAFTASFGFPTSVFSSYYYLPDAAKPTQEPQPVLYDPMLNVTFPYNLTNPDSIPHEDEDPIYFPIPVQNISYTQKDDLIIAAVANITKLLDNSTSLSNCAKCQAALTIAKSAVLLAPERAPEVMVNLCQKYGFKSNSSCEEEFTARTFGYIWIQVLFFGDMAGLDGQYVCSSLSDAFCPAPKTSLLDTKSLFTKPKPKNTKRHKPSGKRVKVLHMSDFHCK
jgi:hypothetical protein